MHGLLQAHLEPKLCFASPAAPSKTKKGTQSRSNRKYSSMDDPISHVQDLENADKSLESSKSEVKTLGRRYSELCKRAQSAEHAGPAACYGIHVSRPCSFEHPRRELQALRSNAWAPSCSSYGSMVKAHGSEGTAQP